MKTASMLLLVLSSLALTGCVATEYHKSISITKDANGNVISTTETEGVTQPGGSGYPITFEHLKGVMPGGPK
jgi:hypothetical protein